MLKFSTPTPKPNYNSGTLRLYVFWNQVDTSQSFTRYWRKGELQIKSSEHKKVPYIFACICKKFAVFRLSQGLCSRKRCQRQYELGPAPRRQEFKIISIRLEILNQHVEVHQIPSMEEKSAISSAKPVSLLCISLIAFIASRDALH